MVFFVVEDEQVIEEADVLRVEGKGILAVK